MQDILVSVSVRYVGRPETECGREESLHHAGPEDPTWIHAVAVGMATDVVTRFLEQHNNGGVAHAGTAAVQKG